MSKTERSVEAKHGKRMIQVTVRFWVNDIAKEKGKIIPSLITSDTQLQTHIAKHPML